MGIECGVYPRPDWEEATVALPAAANHNTPCRLDLGPHLDDGLRYTVYPLSSTRLLVHNCCAGTSARCRTSGLGSKSASWRHFHDQGTRRFGLSHHLDRSRRSCH